MTGPQNARLWRGRGNQGSGSGSKYGNRRAYSPLCNRTFDSIAELRFGEQLALRLKAGDITDLEYQPAFVLRAARPRVTYRADFAYREVQKQNANSAAAATAGTTAAVAGRLVVVDVKGVLTPLCRVKLAWLLEKRPDVRVTLLRQERDGRFVEVAWSSMDERGPPAGGLTPKYSGLQRPVHRLRRGSPSDRQGARHGAEQRACKCLQGANRPWALWKATADGKDQWRAGKGGLSAFREVRGGAHGTDRRSVN